MSLKKATVTSKKAKYKLCEICGTYTVKSDGCFNIQHYIYSKIKGKERK